MSTNYTGSSQSDPSTVESDTLFGANPIWERSAKKRRGFGGSKTGAAATATTPVATTETFEPAPTNDQLVARELRAERLRSDAMMGAGAASLTGAPLASDAAAAETPIYASRTTTARKSGGVAPLAVAAGVIVLGGLAAAGWYATRDDGVTQLTPGGTATSTAALETAPMASAPASQMAANTATAPAAASPTATRSTTTTVRSAAPSRAATTTRTASVRTRPAPATSAADAGVNTSATLPTAPLPYSATTDGATAPATVNPAPTPPSAVEPAADPSASGAPPSQPSAAPTPSTFQLTPPVTSDPTP
jgi:hypothetical protein